MAVKNDCECFLRQMCENVGYPVTLSHNRTPKDVSEAEACTIRQDKYEAAFFVTPTESTLHTHTGVRVGKPCKCQRGQNEIYVNM